MKNQPHRLFKKPQNKFLKHSMKLKQDEQMQIILFSGTIQIESVGFNLGFGNRWSFNRNITFGIDWISWARPVVELNKNSAFLDHAANQQDRDDVEKGTHLISYFPRFSFHKLQLGILFSDLI